MPGRTEVTRETSREDAIASTRRFFNAVTERRSATDVPVTTTMSVTQTDMPPVTSIPVETEHQEPEIHLKELFFLVDCPLDLLLQLHLGLERGNKECQRDKQELNP